MPEDLGKIIGKGFETYRKNLNLGIPFLLDAIITGLLAIIMVGVLLFSIISSSTTLEHASPERVILTMLSIIHKHLLEIMISIIVYILISLFISSFFTAGAIGMAKQAIETGKSELSFMIEEGKRNVVNLFLAEILVGLLYLVGIVFLVPGAMKIDINNLLPPKLDAILLLIAGILIWVIYSLILSVVLAMYRYALVVSHLPPIEGILAGVRFFSRHKLDVFILWLIALSMAVVLMIAVQIMNLIPVLKVISPFISLFISTLIIAPLTTVWWVYLFIKNQ